MNQKRAVEELAKKRGVVLAAPAPGAPLPLAQPPVSNGWLAKPMPEAAAMMVEVKGWLDPKLYAAAMDNLKRGAGYVVDESTMIALGSPPLHLYERGKTEQRNGFTIMRVKPKIQR